MTLMERSQAVHLRVHRMGSSSQLPFELANLTLGLLDLFLPASDTLSKPIVAIAVDGSSTLINLARFEFFHRLDSFVIQSVVLQLLLLAFFGPKDVMVALFDLLFELSKLSV